MSNVFVDNLYVYQATDNKLTIYILEDSSELVSLTYDCSITSLWCNDAYLFLGTSTSGVLYMDKNILSSFSSSDDVYNATLIYKNGSELTSDYVRWLHGTNDCLSVCTSLGVDFLKFEPYGYRNFYLNPNIYKGFVVNSKEFYYTVSGTDWAFCKANPIENWYSDNILYTTGSGTMADASKINDLYVTSVSGNNTLFIATDGGLYVINEATDDYVVVTTIY